MTSREGVLSERSHAPPCVYSIQPPTLEDIESIFIFFIRGKQRERETRGTGWCWCLRLSKKYRRALSKSRRWKPTHWHAYKARQTCSCICYIYINTATSVLARSLLFVRQFFFFVAIMLSPISSRLFSLGASQYSRERESFLCLQEVVH